MCIGLYKIIRGRCAINEVPLMNRTRDTWKWGIASVKVCPTVVIRRLKRQSALLRYLVIRFCNGHQLLRNEQSQSPESLQSGISLTAQWIVPEARSLPSVEYD